MGIFNKNDKNDHEEVKEQERRELEEALKGLREVSMDDLEKISGGALYRRNTGY